VQKCRVLIWGKAGAASISDVSGVVFRALRPSLLAGGTDEEDVEWLTVGGGGVIRRDTQKWRSEALVATAISAGRVKKMSDCRHKEKC
jgi:hypothetical protein